MTDEPDEPTVGKMLIDAGTVSVEIQRAEAI
jgi:hypothetical protein